MESSLLCAIPTVTSVAVAPGDTIDERYQVLERLGRGGMADVWAATDLSSRRQVALKLMHVRTAKDPVLIERMQREARIAAAIQSPYVCAVLGSGSARGRPYIVYERLDGEPLSRLLSRETSLPFSEVAILFDNVLEGLVAAHTAGAIHRDLTPANIFLQDVSTGRRAKILDFGISKERAPSVELTLTRDGSELGSLAYMAPEQAKAAWEVDERADIYAVGTIMFRALAGRLPFEASSPRAVVAMKVERDPPSLGEVTAEVWPADLERFLQTSLSRRREDRFPSAWSALAAWRMVVAHTDSAREKGARASRHPPPPVEAVEENTRTETMTMTVAHPRRISPKGTGRKR
ncbi:MAG: serine/threonine protein kinase [Deltaproteobacteria bacterium]|nr:serine/threonine protein kinase [Deltaproteobacteria bacterium]